jgi:hypothetical protein
MIVSMGLNRRSTNFFAVAGLVGISTFACGGDDAVVTNPADSSTPDVVADTSVLPDSSTPQDSAADTSVLPDSGPDAGFTIKSVTGLSLWLDAAQGVTADGAGLVSKWADQSGNGNDAVQANAKVQPLQVAQGINNKPSIRFTTNPNSPPFPNMSVPDAPSLQLGTGDFYIASVVRWSNGNGALGMIVSKQNVANPFAGYAMYMNFPSAGHAGGQLDANTNVGSTLASLNDNTPRQYAFVRSGGTASIRVNGASDGTLANTNVTSDATGVALSIGGLTTGNGLHPLAGDIAELIIVKGSITTNNRDAIESYLKAKYGL